MRSPKRKKLQLGGSDSRLKVIKKDYQQGGSYSRLKEIKKDYQQAHTPTFSQSYSSSCFFCFGMFSGNLHVNPMMRLK